MENQAVLNSLLIRPSLCPGLPHGPVLHGLGDLTLTMLPKACSLQGLLFSEFAAYLL